MINSIRHPVMDVIYSIESFIGDGIFVIVIVIVFFISKRKGIAWVLLLGFLFLGILCQMLKFCINESRPVDYFSNGNYIQVGQNQIKNKRQLSRYFFRLAPKSPF